MYREPSYPKPSSVNNLRPADIEIVAALGEIKV